MDVLEHEQVPRSEFALQAGRQVLGLVLERAARVRQQHRRALPLDQALNHRPGANAVDVADHRSELDARVVEHLVQPVELAGHIADSLRR